MCFLWLSLPGHYRVTDEVLLAETVLWMFSLLLKELIFYFYLPSLKLVLCRVAAVKRLPNTAIVKFIFYFWSFEISVNILRNHKYMIGLDSYSRQVSNYLDPILIYISLWIDSLFEIRKIAVCFLWLSLPGQYRVTDEALLAETT